MKKILISLAVIAAGVMLGVIFASPSIRDNSQKESNNNFTNQNQNRENTISPGRKNIEVKMVATPAEVRNNASLSADLKNAERTILGITYKNNTDTDLTGIQIEIVSSSPNTRFKLTSSNSAKLNKEVTEANKRLTFDVAEVKAGQTNEAVVFLYPQSTGEIKVHSTIKTQDGKKATSLPVTIIVR